jgi:DNA polymerase-3 subunit epsilon
MNVTILDCETTGTDPNVDRAIEVGAILFSVDHMAPVVSYAALLRADGQPAASEAVNGIPSAILPFAPDAANVWSRIGPMFAASSAVLAHHAEFDRAFVPEDLRGLRPWVCTMDDVAWPKGAGSKGLVALALAHGLGVATAHRALADCDLVARLLMRCHELGHDVPAMLARGMRPKGRYKALVNYGTNALAKAAGFHFDGVSKDWTRSMAVDDVAALPFKVQRLDGAA